MPPLARLAYWHQTYSNEEAELGKRRCLSSIRDMFKRYNCCTLEPKVIGLQRMLLSPELVEQDY
jgi:hypothetical protein